MPCGCHWGRPWWSTMSESWFRRSWLWSTGTRSLIYLHYHPFPPWGHLLEHQRIKGHKRVDSSSVIIHQHTFREWWTLAIGGFCCPCSQDMKRHTLWVCCNVSDKADKQRKQQDDPFCQTQHWSQSYNCQSSSVVWWVTAWRISNERLVVWKDC